MTEQIIEPFEVPNPLFAPETWSINWRINYAARTGRSEFSCSIVTSSRGLETNEVKTVDLVTDLDEHVKAFLGPIEQALRSSLQTMAEPHKTPF